MERIKNMIRFHEIQKTHDERIWRNYILSCLTTEAKVKYGITVSFSDEWEENGFYDEPTESTWIDIEVSHLRNGKVFKRFSVCLTSTCDTAGICDESRITRSARSWYIDFLRQVNSFFIGSYRTFDGLYIYDRKKFENDDRELVTVSRDTCSCVFGCELCD
jgi:hypothetical protein